MASKQQSKTQAQKKRKQINVLPLYVFLVIVFALYLLYQHIAIVADILGLALLFSIIAIIFLEVANGVAENGYSKNIIELAIVVVVVIGVWLGLRIVLHTPYPLDVVPSCSMLPTLQRGSMLFLQGVSGTQGLHAPIVNITQNEYTQIATQPSQEFLSCVAYSEVGDTAKVSQYMEPGYSIGLYDLNNGGYIVPLSYQDNNTIQYECGVSRDLLANGSTIGIVTTNAILIGNTTVTGDRNNSIIVYATTPQDLFYQEGDSYIVHRLYAILNVSGHYYFLTKGDNNPGLDIQYGNYPSSESAVEGKVIASVPYLGYLKLILSNQFNEPAGCNTTIIN